MCFCAWTQGVNEGSLLSHHHPCSHLTPAQVCMSYQTLCLQPFNLGFLIVTMFFMVTWTGFRTSPQGTNYYGATATSQMWATLEPFTQLLVRPAHIHTVQCKFSTHATQCHFHTTNTRQQCGFTKSVNEVINYHFLLGGGGGAGSAFSEFLWFILLLC